MTPTNLARAPTYRHAADTLRSLVANGMSAREIDGSIAILRGCDEERSALWLLALSLRHQQVVSGTTSGPAGWHW